MLKILIITLMLSTAKHAFACSGEFTEEEVISIKNSLAAEALTQVSVSIEQIIKSDFSSEFWLKRGSRGQECDGFQVGGRAVFVMDHQCSVVAVFNSEDDRVNIESLLKCR